MHRYDLGALCHEAGAEDEALAMYERAHALHDHDPLLLQNRAAALLQAGRYRDAFRSYRRCLEADPHATGAMLTCLEMLCGLERCAGAAAVLRRAPPEVRGRQEVRELARELGLRP